MGDPVVVRRAGPDDDAALARLHRRAFPDYPTSRLGPGFCTALLRAYRERPDGAVLVADGPSGPDGYLVLVPPSTARAVTASLRPRAARALLTRLWSPRLWPVAIARLRRSGDRVEGSGPRSDHQIGEGPAGVRVVLVGVAPEARGRGVADALLAASADEAAARGHDRIDLVVATGNQAARRAYARNGWVPAAGSDPASGSLRYERVLGAG